MTTLKDLLDSLEIKTDDLEEKKEEKELTPEEQVKKLTADQENLKNEIAARDLAIKTLKDAVPKNVEIKKEEEKKEEFDPDDRYTPIFKSLKEEIISLKKEKERDARDTFTNNLRAFAAKHKDIVRYANLMDEIKDQHPSLINDIPRLYNLAKLEKEGRDKLIKEKEEDLERTGKVKKFQTERSGMAGSNVKDISNAKSIHEAYEMTEKQAQTRR